MYVYVICILYLYIHVCMDVFMSVFIYVSVRACLPACVRVCESRHLIQRLLSGLESVELEIGSIDC